MIGEEGAPGPRRRPLRGTERRRHASGLVDVVYLDDAEFNRLVEERKAKPMSTSSGPQRQP